MEEAFRDHGAEEISPGRWTCPGHGSVRDTLSLAWNDETKRVLIHCFAGCSDEHVITSVGLTWAMLRPARDIPAWALAGHSTGEYPYADEEGIVLYRVIRGEGKTFRQAAADGTPSVKGIRRVLFNLPRVVAHIKAGGTVDLCEGEKDAHALAYSGLTPTCNSGGANQWHDELADSLTGAAHVRVWRDRDDPGAAWAQRVTASLIKREIPFSVVEAAEGKDAWDHFAAGYALDEAVPVDLSAGLGTAPDTGAPGMHRTGDTGPDGRTRLVVSSQAECSDWLRKTLGTGPLSGIFERDGRLVRVPRIGEQGYEEPRKNETGPARVDPLAVNQVRAMVDVRYDCGANKQSKASDGTVRWSWENRMFPRNSAESAVTAAEMGEGAPGVRSLRGVTHTPAVRDDWSVLDTPGFDEPTGLLYLPDVALGPVNVPGAPSAQEIRSARDLVLEPVAQFPFVHEDHRANWVGAMLTPLLRRVLPPPYPMVVFTATNPGSGKGYLARMLREVHGGDLRPDLPRDSEELRKQITALLLNTTSPVVTWDNLRGTVKSPVLEALLTTDRHADRELGKSNDLRLTNDRLWTATGNNATFGGDLGRRLLTVALDPPGEGQHRRTDFRLHPVHWIRARRAEYLGALLTLVRGWHLDGMPQGKSAGDDYGVWAAAVGGMLTWAEVPGTFGGGADRVRDEEAEEWAVFLRAVHRVFGTSWFRVRDLVARISLTDTDKTGIQPEELPGELAEKFVRSVHARGGFIKTVGKWFAFREGRYVEGWKSETLPSAKNGHRYRIVPPSDEVILMSEMKGCPEGGFGGLGGVSEGLLSSQISETVSTVGVKGPRGDQGADTPTKPPNPPADPGHRQIPGTPLGIDLETDDADKLYLSERNGQFVRLAGVTPATVTERVPEALAALEGAPVIYGHNLFGFDLQALARHHGADYMDLASRAVDTMTLARLTDPPGAKGMKPWSVRGYYGLDAVAERMGLPGKTDDLKALAKEFGGYGSIPQDDPRYRAYLQGDLDATTAVYERFVASGALTDYARREMRVNALQHLMTVNGCRVDTALLAERQEAEAERRRGAVEFLGETCGMPVTGAKPWTTKAGKDALVRAFQEAGAEFVPRTPTGAPKLGKDALGDGTWVNEQGHARPGMLRVYGHIPAVKAIVDAILTATGAADKYAEVGKYLTDEGRVHPAVGDVQASGRWAYIRPSLTNVGKRGRALEQRAVIVPEPGHVLMAFDFDQVDMRAVAGHSGDAEYAKLFEPGRDAHSEIADTVFGRHDGEWRDRAKAIGHGWNYGRGVSAISESNGLPLGLVQQFDDAMRERFPVLMQWKRDVAELGGAGELLDNGFGRLMRCDPLRSYTQAPALLGQGGARDIMCEGLLRLPSELWPYLRLVIHDEVLLSVPEADAEDIRDTVLKAFTMEFKGIPVTAGASKPGRDWRDCYRK